MSYYDPFIGTDALKMPVKRGLVSGCFFVGLKWSKYKLSKLHQNRLEERNTLSHFFSAFSSLKLVVDFTQAKIGPKHTTLDLRLYAGISRLFVFSFKLLYSSLPYSLAHSGCMNKHRLRKPAPTMALTRGAHLLCRRIVRGLGRAASSRCRPPHRHRAEEEQPRRGGGAAEE